MAAVSGMTVEAVEAYLDEMITEVRVDANGQLISKTRGGDEINSGTIVSPNLAVAKAWPVGSIFICTTSTNPNILLGVGTWARFGQGRTLLSQSSSDSDFDAAEEVGGSKTVTLSQLNLPPHTHSFSGSLTVSATSRSSNPDEFGDAPSNNGGSVAMGRAIARVSHAINMINPKTTSSGPGSSEPVETLPPYIVTYMWKRTA